MTKDPKGEKLATEIASMFKATQQQLSKLRDAVEKNAALGSAKVRLEAVQRDREAKLVVLGEAALNHYRDGKDVPSALRIALEGVKVAEAKVQAQRSTIADLLAEADVVREKPGARKPSKK